MDKNNKSDKNTNENLGESNKEIKTDNITKKNFKNLSQSTNTIQKKISSHEYFFSSGIYQMTPTLNKNTNNLNNNAINPNNSNHVNNNYQYQNMLNNNQYPINNMNQNIYSNNMRNQSLFPNSQYNNANYNNYNLRPQYMPNQQNLFYAPNFFNNFNNNTMNIQNFQNNNLKNNDRRRHTIVFNPRQFQLNLDENKNNQYRGSNFNINNNNSNKTNIGNNKRPSNINHKEDKIKEESDSNDSSSNASKSESESENSNNNSDEENSDLSQANDFFKNIEETIEVMKKDNQNKDSKNKGNQKNNKEKKNSAHENKTSDKSNDENENLHKNEDNQINNNISEELEKKDIDYNNDMIKCLEGEDETESDCESMQIYEELPKDIHNHPFNKQPLSNEKCIMCLCEKSCQEGYKCKECPLILCQDCSSMIVINYYGNKRHEHPLSISNKDNFKCNNCKKKIFNKNDFYFYCHKCTFYMCLKCYYPERREENEEIEEKLDDDDKGDSDEEEPMHDHPLKNISKSNQFICKLCDNTIEKGYKCINCDLNLCQECANFIYSHKKKQNLHEHSLYLTVETDWKCEKCKKNFKEKACFNCNKCSLDYCVDCFFE